MSVLKANKRFWLSLYIYHESTADSLLAEVLFPFLQAMLIAGSVRQFFFIRYFDQQGPHIRLRLSGDAETLTQEVLPQIELVLHAITGEKLTLKADASDTFEPGSIPADRIIDTIQYQPYIPETARFGGPIGLSIAEDHFSAASAAVLESMNQLYPDWDYDQAMGTAIRLHLALIHGTNWSRKQMSDFFQMVCHQWIPRSFPNQLHNPSPKQRELQTLETLDYYQKAWNSQEKALSAYITSILVLLDSGQSFDDESYEKWRLHTRFLYQSLTEAQRNNSLLPRPQDFVSPAFGDVTSKDHLIYHLLADFIHLTNNRLGISNRDEGFLAFILWKGI